MTSKSAALRVAVSPAPVVSARRTGGVLAWRRWLPAVVLVALLLAAWELGCAWSGISSLVLPRPSEVAVLAVSQAPLYLRHASVTATEVLLGFLLATALGSLFGVLVASSRLVGGAIYPNLVIAQITPKVAFAPLLVIWFGFGLLPKLVMVTVIAFFPVVITMIVGLNLTTREASYLFRSMGASRAQTFWKLRLPAAFPVLFGGLKVASTLSVIGAVVAEFTGAKSGLGFLLTNQVGLLQTPEAFASVFYLTLLGLLLFLAVGAAERVIVPSHMLRRMDGGAPAGRIGS